MADIICKGTEKSNKAQWLSSKCTSSYLSTNFYVRCINDGIMDSKVTFQCGGNQVSSGYYGLSVRPVVTLNSNIHFSGNGIDGWTIE